MDALKKKIQKKYNKVVKNRKFYQSDVSLFYQPFDDFNQQEYTFSHSSQEWTCNQSLDENHSKNNFEYRFDSSEDCRFLPLQDVCHTNNKRGRESDSDEENYCIENNAKKPRLAIGPSVEYAIKKSTEYQQKMRKALIVLFESEITADGWQKINNEFKYHTRIRGTTYAQSGSTIDLAREAASKAALEHLAKFRFEDICWPKNILRCRLDQPFADAIEIVVKKKFHEFMQNSPLLKRHKVLSGIVMTKGMSVNDAKVVAISSGTKCYSNKYEDKNGTVLHDMHSEVLARRSFIRFLYTELTAMADGKASIFFVNGNEIQLKADLKFHLYVNAIPCGDARVFSLNGCVNLKRTALRTKQINEIDIPSEPFTAKQGALRTKRIDGTHILSENKTQRVTSMSCSDKILRWNTLGLQGAALTKIIKPIYLESIVLGSHYVPIHLHRAIYGRLNDCVNIPKLPDGYRLNQPRFESTFVMEIKNFAIQDRGICWSVGFEPEMLNLNTGLNTSGDMSRVSKAFILSLSQLLNERLSNRFNDTGISKYNAAKDIFYETLKKNYGNWGNTN